MDKKEGRSYTYLMRDGHVCKIGKSKNPEQRLHSIKTSRPKIRLVGYSTKHSEKHIQKRYKKYNIGGEWFKFPESVFQSAVKDICNKEQREFQKKYEKRLRDRQNKQRKKQKG